MITICVLFGGVSAEHDVSLRSAATILKNLSKEKYNIIPVGITKQGEWLLYTGSIEAIENGSWATSENVKHAIISPDRCQKGILIYENGKISLKSIDVVFPALHGKNGEDGTIQGLLELADLPYVGCGVLSSATCMDKAYTHVILKEVGIPKTDLVSIKFSQMANFPKLEKKLDNFLDYPMFVKPANAGSSIGVTKVKTSIELEAALHLAFKHDNKAIVERMVVGQEIQCAVLGSENPITSEIIGEIVVADGIHDFNSEKLNYVPELLIPANIPNSAVEMIKETAIAAYKIMGCRGLAKVDFFFTKFGQVILNEINTMPVFTSISMYPKLFESSGLCIADLIDSLVSDAIKVNRNECDNG